MSVSAIIVTRGDVDLSPVLESLPQEWEVIAWDNGRNLVTRWTAREPFIVEKDCEDLAVYGRYAAIEHASNEIIYVQDDDVLHHVEGLKTMVRAWHESKAAVDDPRSLWHESPDNLREIGAGRHIACNMPAAFRHSFYEEHSLVGFGAVFHRDAPEEAFASFWTGVTLGTIPAVDTDFFERTCDIVFTALTPRVLVDVPYEDLPWASAENRMWKQPTHREERGRMLDLVKQVRDGG